MKTRIKHKKSFLAILSLASLCIGYSSFLVSTSNTYLVDDTPYTLAKETDDKVVAFNDTTNSRYTKLARAINDAKSGETVYVIPGSFTSISSNCTLASGATLCLPFEGNDASSYVWNGRQEYSESADSSNDSWREDIGSANFADQNQTNVDKYLVSSVTIDKNVTFNNYGTVQIGGVLGVETQILAGATSGYYCQFVLDNNAKIENHKTFKCMGYIKETSKNNSSKINNYEYSIMYLPIVFYDYKGGTYTVSVYGGNTKIFPLNQYDFPNNQVETTFNYQSNLVGYADLYTNAVSKTLAGITATMVARHNVDDLNIIGPSNSFSLYELTDPNSSITMKYTPNGDNQFTTYSTSGSYRSGSNGITTMNLNGNINFGQFELGIEAAGDVTLDKLQGLEFIVEAMVKNLNQTISTNTVVFPIPWNFKINVESGTFNVNHPVKFLGGSELTISEGASLVNNSQINVYDASSGSALYSDTAYASTIYPVDKGEAKIINNGTITLKSGSSFGGRISSNIANASINVESGANLSFSTHEGNGSYNMEVKTFLGIPTGVDITFTFTNYANSPINKNANVLNTSGNEEQLSAGSYTSIDAGGNIYYQKN